MQIKHVPFNLPKPFSPATSVFFLQLAGCTGHGSLTHTERHCKASVNEPTKPTEKWLESSSKMGPKFINSSQGKPNRLGEGVAGCKGAWQVNNVLLVAQVHINTNQGFNKTTTYFESWPSWYYNVLYIISIL